MVNTVATALVILSNVCHSSGSGEPILKSAAAAKAAMHYTYDHPVDVAIGKSLAEVAGLFPRSSCGIIAIDSHGSVTMQCSSRIFAIGCVTASIPPSSQIMRCTMPILPQHITHKDDLLSAGLIKYPTVPGQLILQLEKGSSIVSLEQQEFLSFFDHVRICARALQRHLGEKTCAFVMSGRKEGILSPFARHQPSTGRDTELSNELILRCPKIAEQPFHSIPTQNHEIFNLSQNPEPPADSHQIPSVIRIDSPADIFSLSSTTFQNLIHSIWTTTRTISHTYSLPLDDLRITIDPFAKSNTESASTSTQIRITAIDSTVDGPRYFPAPAPMTDRWPGYLTPEFGVRAGDLSALDELAGQIKRATKEVLTEGL